MNEQDEILDRLQRVFRIITECPREVARREARMVVGLYGYRPYHNIHHAILVGSRALALANSKADDEPALFLAAMYHDCIYAPGDPNNERLSAKAAVNSLKNMGVEEQLRQDVDRLIMSTANHRPRRRDEAILCDADLWGLGNKAEYDRNTISIRQEFAHISDEKWRIGRLAFINGMLDRHNIFNTEYGISEQEGPARLNLLNERKQLNG